MYWTRIDELRFANRHIRTISRVIVHPQFRAGHRNDPPPARGGRTRILVNLTHVPFIDSLGIGDLVRDSRRPSAPAGN
jgi:hypothetical protein